MTKRVFGAILFLSLIACTRKSLNLPKVSNKTEQYNFSDVSGQFIMKKTNLIKNKELVTRTELLSTDDQKLSEKTITVSTYGYIRKKPMLRPRVSQYTVWLNKKKYFSQIKINKNKRALDIIYKSEDKDWNGTETVRFPNSKMVYCFYSQLAECLKTSQLFATAKMKKAYATFQIILDSYPFINHHYVGLKRSPFMKASITYEEEASNGQKYTIRMAGQLITLLVAKDFSLLNMFWPAQGLSLGDLN